MASLNPESELKLFFNELLSPFDLTIDDPLLSSVGMMSKLTHKLSQASFSGYLNFIGSLQIIIKTMGSLLIGNGYLDRVAVVFVQVLSLTKRFIKHLKLSIAEGAADGIMQ